MDERAVPEPLRVGYQARIHSIKSGKHSGDKNRQRIHEHPYPDLAPRTPRGALSLSPAHDCGKDADVDSFCQNSEVAIRFADLERSNDKENRCSQLLENTPS